MPAVPPRVPSQVAPGSHFSPAGRFLGFPLHGAQMNRSIRCERGQKGGVLKVKAVALRGSRGPEGAAFSELRPERGWAWGAVRKPGPGRNIYPGVKTQGSGQGAAPQSARCRGQPGGLSTTCALWVPRLFGRGH